MVKTPRTRHSKVSREPVTIDLGPEEVSRIKADQGEASEEKTAGPNPTTEADTAASSEEKAVKSRAGAFEYGFEEHPAEAKPEEAEAAASEQARMERDQSAKAPEPPPVPRRAANGLAAGLIGELLMRIYHEAGGAPQFYAQEYVHENEQKMAVAPADKAQDASKTIV